MARSPGCEAESRAPDIARLVSALALAGGVGTATLAVLYRPSVATLLGLEPRVVAPLEAYMASARTLLVFVGALGGVVAELLHPRLLRGRLPAGTRVQKRAAQFILAIAPVAWLVFAAEIALRPFADLSPKSTDLFVRDRELGWKLRPGASGEWGGVVMTVNEKGLRGPAIPYERSPNSFRILYLGDSVTFGYGIARTEDTFPSVVESHLAPISERRIETVNAGVGGYAPWQEWGFLRTEGIRYDPDCVVLTFILNDVTEIDSLTRFGGAGEGFQLSHSYYSLYDRFSHESSIGFFVERLRQRLRYGSDLGAGATRAAAKQVQDLILQADDPRIEELWSLTFESLDRIYEFCGERDVAIVTVMLPYRFQLRHPDELAGPQRRIEEHAARWNVPFCDLLPRLTRFGEETRRLPSDLYLDDSHLNEEGCAEMGRWVAEFLSNTVLAGRLETRAEISPTSFSEAATSRD